MTEYPSAHYVRELRPLLPPEVFQPHAGRLFWMGVHMAIIAAGITLTATVDLAWPWLLLGSAVIGHSYTGMAFAGHEILHGAVVKSRRWSHALGFVCLLPFTLSPRLWKAWHNQTHHANTMRPGADPDAYPTLADYQKSWKLRFMDRIALGRGRMMGWVCLGMGFTGQSLQMFLNAKKDKMVSPREYRAVLGETALSLGIWMTLAWAIGPRAFVFAYLLPMIAANTVAMAYILTNHHLSPHTTVNDPLLNSLTVTVSPVVDALHSSFGLHVEHHLFPAMPAVHARKVRQLLIEKWPERYQSMPLLTAVRRLMQTPRVYSAPTVLFDPLGGYSTSTLVPKTQQAEPLSAAG
jgi:fatty acid desaturase